jgi:hypothetical protein
VFHVVAGGIPLFRTLGGNSRQGGGRLRMGNRTHPTGHSQQSRKAGQGMNQRNLLTGSMREIRARAWLGLIAVVIALIPWPGHADDQWTEGRKFGVLDAADGSGAPPVADAHLVAALTPGSVLVAQAGGTGTEASPEGWRFSVAPYLWGARTHMKLDVGQFSRSTTIDFVDVIPQLHFAFAAHFEATVQKWTAFGDLLYMSIGQSETQNGVSVSTNLQELFFEFGAMYRLVSVPVGQTGRLTFEPLAGGRFMWVDVSLGFPNQKVSDSASVIDPMVGGRITYHITDTVALWFRGDVAGFGISDN